MVKVSNLVNFQHVVIFCPQILVLKVSPQATAWEAMLTYSNKMATNVLYKVNCEDFIKPANVSLSPYNEQREHDQQLHREFLSNLQDHDIICNGSKSKSGFHKNNGFYRQFLLHIDTSIYNAEAIAIKETLKYYKAIGITK